MHVKCNCWDVMMFSQFCHYNMTVCQGKTLKLVLCHTVFGKSQSSGTGCWCPSAPCHSSALKMIMLQQCLQEECLTMNQIKRVFTGCLREESFLCVGDAEEREPISHLRGVKQRPLKSNRPKYRDTCLTAVSHTPKDITCI